MCGSRSSTGIQKKAEIPSKEEEDKCTMESTRRRKRVKIPSNNDKDEDEDKDDDE